MKGRKFQSKNDINRQNKKNIINSYKNNNKDISPHLNVLQLNIKENKIINNNNFNKGDKNDRNLSQKPIHRANINIQNNNYYFNNINNNFIIKNSNSQKNPNNNNKNQINKNSQRQLKPIINKNKNPENKKIKNKNNFLSNNENIIIKLDQKGVYISQEDDIFEDQNDPVNKLNTALKYKQENNLAISQEEKNMIETIKKVSSNRVQYRNTHQMLKEIGKIMKDPVVSFLIKKEPEIKQEEPSDKLSEMLSKKMLEEQRQKMKEKEEDLYYEQLQKKIKDEIRNKGSFDFAKLPDKDRKMLAQRKVYNKIGLKVYENYANNNDINSNESNKINIDDNNIDEKINNQIKEEINREKKKEDFLIEVEKYKEDDEDDDYFNLGEINKKKIKGFDEEIDNEISKEKPTARNILEKVLNKIEYKNEQLINHNRINENVYKKKENNRKKFFDN